MYSNADIDALRAEVERLKGENARTDSLCVSLYVALAEVRSYIRNGNYEGAMDRIDGFMIQYGEAKPSNSTKDK